MTEGRRSAGFTLVEMIIVIVVGGIISGIVAVLIPGPIQAYFAQERRAELTDSAEMVLRRIARDIRGAVPNSVRVEGGGTAIGMIAAIDGGRYRTEPGPGITTDQRLLFVPNETSFNIMGPLTTPAAERLIIYNLGQAGADAWAGDPVMTPPGVAIEADPDLAGEWRVTMPPHRFPLQSPRQRVYLVDTAVRYHCSDGALHRQSGYLPPAAAPAGAVMARNVADCDFTYDPGTATRSGLVTMRIAVEKEGERVTLLHQVHVVNAP